MLTVAEALLMFLTADVKLCLSDLDVCVRTCAMSWLPWCVCVFILRNWGEGEARWFGGLGECWQGSLGPQCLSLPRRDFQLLSTSWESQEVS